MIAALFRRRPAKTDNALTLQTARLHLHAITPAMLNAEPEGAALGGLLGAGVPADWPPQLWESTVWTHIAAQLHSQPNTLGWHRYMVSMEGTARLVRGVGGFPCGHGDVELGYSVATSEQRQGYATEAVRGLMAWLFTRGEVRSISAQALETSPASLRVMQHCGMVCVGKGDNPGTMRYRRWRA